jgi:hypothetical protein
MIVLSFDKTAATGRYRVEVREGEPDGESKVIAESWFELRISKD